MTRGRDNARTRRVTLRLTDGELEELRDAAEKVGETVPEYAAWAAIVAAREELGLDPIDR